MARPLVLSLCLLAGSWFLTGLRPLAENGHALASEKETEDERRQREEREQAEKEDAADHEAGRNPYLTITGTIELAAPPEEGQKPPEVVGVLTEKGTGRQFALKLSYESLRPILARYNHKEAKVGGKIRNEGRYFIAEDIIEQTPPQQPFKSGGGRGKNF